MTNISSARAAAPAIAKKIAFVSPVFGTKNIPDTILFQPLPKKNQARCMIFIKYFYRPKNQNSAMPTAIGKLSESILSLWRMPTLLPAFLYVPLSSPEDSFPKISE